jgi:hypothetical protein
VGQDADVFHARSIGRRSTSALMVCGEVFEQAGARSSRPAPNLRALDARSVRRSRATCWTAPGARSCGRERRNPRRRWPRPCPAARRRVAGSGDLLLVGGYDDQIRLYDDLMVIPERALG